MKTRVNILINKKTWKRYKILCLKKDKIPSHEIEKFMKRKIKNVSKGL